MNCSKCNKKFDANDQRLDNTRLTASVGCYDGRPHIYGDGQVSIVGMLSPGCGEFRPLCVNCYGQKEK